MMLMKRLLVLGLLIGLAGCTPETTEKTNVLTQDSGERVQPGQALIFPRDHGPHGQFGIEWWYLTANLWDQDGQHHGVQWTLFRIKGEEASSDWWQGQWYMAHLAWESPEHHRAWERWGRGGIGQAGVRAAPFVAWLDDWQLSSRDDGFLPLHLIGGQDDFRMALQLSDSPQVRHGDDGYSRKSADGELASYYYSYPMLKVQGHLKGEQGWFPVRGQAWLDREWSSRFLDPRYQGWDWLSAQLDNGEALMVFCMRPTEQADPALRNCEGSRISPDGALTPIDSKQIQWQATNWSRLDDGEYPVGWRLTLANGAKFNIRTLSRDQRNKLSFPYWEGPVRISGETAQGETSGYGFIELTGYGSG